MAQHAWLTAVLTVAPLLGSAQQRPTFIPVVPAADWRQADSQSLPVAMVSKYGGDPAVEQEYGVRALELRTYQLGKTQAQVVVEAAPDAIASYGLLTFYETPAMTPEKDIQLAAGDANETLMLRGNNFIRFLRPQNPPLSANDFQALLIFVGGTKPSAKTLRNLPAAMPAKGLVWGSEKYLIGLGAARRVLPDFRTDLIGFDQGAEVQLGQYQTDKGTSTLVSISYPTPQIARLRFGSLTDLLGMNQNRGKDSIYGKRRGTYVFLALNTNSAGAASALMDQFRVDEGISWDQRYSTERSFTLQLIHMILAILLLTALLIGACMMSGILFYLSRRFAAKFFPESSWGHTDEDQLIRLNLKAQ